MGIAEQFKEAEKALHSGQKSNAERMCREILQLDPNNIDTLNLLGMILSQQKNFVEAVSLFRKMVELRPQDATLHCNLGAALQMAGSVMEASIALEKAVELAPNLSVALYNLANIYKDQGQLTRAASFYLRALKGNPEFTEARHNLVSLHIQRGNIYMDQEDPATALAIYEEALALADGYAHLAEVHYDLGNAHKGLGNFAKAKEYFDTAIALKPDFAEAHWNMAQLLLLTGDYLRGWQEFEWRFKVTPLFNLKRTQWKGESLLGKTILLHAEQGFGDALQFVRYANEIKKLGAEKVIIECLPELSPLLLSAPGVDELALKGDPTPAFDHFAMLMSLPHKLRTTLETIPAQGPYLFPVPSEVKEWADRLREFQGLKVGLVWAGSNWKDQPEATAVDRRRSCHFRQFKPLQEVSGVNFFSLQKGEPAKQQAEVDFPLIDWMNEMTDFSSTAAFVANLDLVITVDTAMAHLTGAIGTPVWVLSRFDGCWRWLLDRDDSPWYPSARVFRQKRPRDWESVIDRVVHSLRDLSLKELKPQRRQA